MKQTTIEVWSPLKTMVPCTSCGSQMACFGKWTGKILDRSFKTITILISIGLHFKFVILQVRPQQHPATSMSCNQKAQEDYLFHLSTPSIISLFLECLGKHENMACSISQHVLKRGSTSFNHYSVSKNILADGLPRVRFNVFSESSCVCLFSFAGICNIFWAWEFASLWFMSSITGFFFVHVVRFWPPRLLNIHVPNHASARCKVFGWFYIFP